MSDCPASSTSLLTNVYEVLDSFENYQHLVPTFQSAQKKKEEQDKFYHQAIQHKKQFLSAAQAIDPNDTRFYLSLYPEMLLAIRRLVNEISFTIASFVEYLVLPQSGKIGPIRQEVFEISKENLEDGFIQPPTLHLNLFQYILYSLLPYKSFLDYETMDVGDIHSINIEPKDLVVNGENYTIAPPTYFTDQELRNSILLPKHTLHLPLQIPDETFHEWRTFLKRVIRALHLFGGPYDQKIEQLQVQTWIVRGIEMTRPEKLKNAMMWIISAGTDWLEKREIDLYDISFAIQLLLGEDGKSYRSAILKTKKSIEQKEIDLLREFILSNDLLAQIDTVEKLGRIIAFILSERDLIGWIDQRLNMFAQL